MPVIVDRLCQVSLDEPQVHLNLTMFPLLADGPAEAGSWLLDDALARAWTARPGAVETFQQELYVLGLSRVPQLTLTGAG